MPADLNVFINFYRYCFSNIDYAQFCRIINKREDDFFAEEKFTEFKKDWAKFIAEYSDWTVLFWDDYLQKYPQGSR